jgi:hypothetical protein
MTSLATSGENGPDEWQLCMVDVFMFAPVVT